MPHAAVQAQTSTRSVAKMSSQGILLLMLMFSASYGELQEEYAQSPPQPEHMDGRSFFFLGTLFRRWRDRWLAFHNPAPLYAGPAYPVNGYYNCPSYGCNPATIGPQPGFYPAYYAAPMPQQTQQQAAQGNSNVYIYQADQNNAAGAAGMAPPPPYGPGFFSPARQPLPQVPAFPPSSSFPMPAALPPPPAMPQPPASSPPQASASSYGFASGPILPGAGCGPNLMFCALG